MRRKTYVTGSTIYNALYLHSAKAMQDHYIEFILKQTPLPEYTDEEKERLAYGTENEVHKMKNKNSNQNSFRSTPFLIICNEQERHT